MCVSMRKGGEADHLVLASVYGLLMGVSVSGRNAKDSFSFEALCVVWGCPLHDECCNFNFEDMIMIGNGELRYYDELLCEENAKRDC